MHHKTKSAIKARDTNKMDEGSFGERRQDWALAFFRANPDSLK
jgi:hypothetical protein